MKVRNPNLPLGEVIGPDGKTYEGDAFGVFDVPSDFGNWLCGTPGWEPEAGARLSDVVTRPEGMSEEEHARQLAEEKQREEEAKAKAEAAKKAEAEAAAVEGDVRAVTQERQVLDGKREKEPLPPATQSAGPPSPAPEVPTGEPTAEGPDLDKMTKGELIACADEYRSKGYAIAEFPADALKKDIKAALSTALYGE